MLKAYRLRNALLIGQFNGETLEALLQNTVYKSALQIIAFDRVWTSDISVSTTAMAAVLASETAMAAVLASETAMAAVAASTTAMAAVAASTTAMAAVLASETAMEAVAASTTAMAAVAASETAMAAVNNSLIAKNAFFVSPKKRTVSVGNNSWNWQNIADGRGCFVRFQGTAHPDNKLKVDNTKDIAVEGADFFKIIPYTSNLKIYRYSAGGTVHYIPFGA